MKPIPEFIYSKEWTKNNSNKGRVDIKNGSIDVPFDDSEGSRLIRIHEYFHIKWSPLTKGIKKRDSNPLLINIISAFEDERVNFLGKQLNIDISNIMDALVFSDKDNITSLLLYIASRQYKSNASLEKNFMQIPLEWKNLTNVLLSQLYKEPKYEKVLLISSILYNILQSHQEKYKGVDAISSNLSLSEIIKNMNKVSTSTHEQCLDLSGEIQIKKYPYSHYRRIASINSPKKLPSEMGMYFKNIHRDLTDKLVFNSNRIDSFKIGTLLIDYSGSMNLSIKEIDNILQNSPGSLISIYSGDINSNTGILHIIAKNNRRLQNISKSLGGNIVDYPALKWLIKQKPPFYWLCDGGVTGKSDHYIKIIAEGCQEIKKKYKIKQFLRKEQLYQFLKGGKYEKV